MKGSGIPHTFLRNDLAVGIAAVLSKSGYENKTYELTAPLPWTFNDLVIALSELSGKPIILRQDPQIQNWIYSFLGKIDTCVQFLHDNREVHKLHPPADSKQISIKIWDRILFDPVYTLFFENY